MKTMKTTTLQTLPPSPENRPPLPASHLYNGKKRHGDHPGSTYFSILSRELHPLQKSLQWSMWMWPSKSRWWIAETVRRCIRQLTGWYWHSLLPRAIGAFYYDTPFDVQLRDGQCIRVLMQKASGSSRLTQTGIVVWVHHSLIGDIYESCWLAPYLNTVLRNCNVRVIHTGRRGHGSPLTHRRFNSVGDKNDLEDVYLKVVAPLVDRMSGMHTNALTIGFGVSAGCTSLASWMLEHPSRLHGAFMVSAGFHFQDALRTMASSWNRKMLEELKRQYLYPLLRSSELTMSLQYLAESSTVMEWHERQHKFAGSRSLSAYWEEHDPSSRLCQIDCPILYLHAEDDPIFRKALLEDHMFVALQAPQSALLTTRHGGHAFFQDQLFQAPLHFRAFARFCRTIAHLRQSRYEKHVPG